ncbi:hypothetical protein LUTEI9C_130061 [Luteimonas sp. 9C]|nr:hypothetical protein LUTEI9C_130061 [Luteimonas sp. 9C]
MGRGGGGSAAGRGNGGFVAGSNARRGHRRALRAVARNVPAFGQALNQSQAGFSILWQLMRN